MLEQTNEATKSTVTEAQTNQTQETIRPETPAKKAFDEIMASIADDNEETQGNTDEVVPKRKEEPEPQKEASGNEAPITTKILHAKKGESTIEVPDDAVLTLKVNKEDVEVPIKELVRNYQGKIPWEKHYQETAEQARKIKQREAEIMTYAAELKAAQEAQAIMYQEIVDLARTNPSEALMKACVKAGKNPGDVLRAVIEQAKATVAQLSELSPEQVETLIAKKGLEYDKALLQEKEAQQAEIQKRNQEQAQLEAYIAKRCADAQITAAEYQMSQDLLQAAVQEGIVKLNGQTPAQIADLIIENIIQVERPRTRLRNVLAQIDPEAARNYNIIAELHTHLGWDLTKYSDEDLNEIIKGVFGDSVSEDHQTVQAETTADLSRGSATKPTPPKIPQKKTRPGMEVGDEEFDPLSIEDIKRAYRRTVE